MMTDCGSRWPALLLMLIISPATATAQGGTVTIRCGSISADLCDLSARVSAQSATLARLVSDQRLRGERLYRWHAEVRDPVDQLLSSGLPAAVAHMTPDDWRALLRSTQSLDHSKNTPELLRPDSKSTTKRSADQQPVHVVQGVLVEPWLNATGRQKRQRTAADTIARQQVLVVATILSAALDVNGTDPDRLLRRLTDLSRLDQQQLEASFSSAVQQLRLQLQSHNSGRQREERLAELELALQDVSQVSEAARNASQQAAEARFAVERITPFVNTLTKSLSDQIAENSRQLLEQSGLSDDLRQLQNDVQRLNESSRLWDQSGLSEELQQLQRDVRRLNDFTKLPDQSSLSETLQQLQREVRRMDNSTAAREESIISFTDLIADTQISLNEIRAAVSALETRLDVTSVPPSPATSAISEQELAELRSQSQLVTELQQQVATLTTEMEDNRQRYLDSERRCKTLEARLNKLESAFAGLIQEKRPDPAQSSADAAPAQAEVGAVEGRSADLTPAGSHHVQLAGVGLVTADSLVTPDRRGGGTVQLGTSIQVTDSDAAASALSPRQLGPEPAAGTPENPERGGWRPLSERQSRRLGAGDRGRSETQQQASSVGTAEPNRGPAPAYTRATEGTDGDGTEAQTSELPSDVAPPASVAGSGRQAEAQPPRSAVVSPYQSVRLPPPPRPPPTPPSITEEKSPATAERHDGGLAEARDEQTGASSAHTGAEGGLTGASGQQTRHSDAHTEGKTVDQRGRTGPPTLPPYRPGHLPPPPQAPPIPPSLRDWVPLKGRPTAGGGQTLPLTPPWLQPPDDAELYDYPESVSLDGYGGETVPDGASLDGYGGETAPDSVSQDGHGGETAPDSVSQDGYVGETVPGGASLDGYGEETAQNEVIVDPVSGEAWKRTRVKEGSWQKRRLQCRPAGLYAKVESMEQWCHLNCPIYCPKTHCTCTWAGQQQV